MAIKLVNDDGTPITMAMATSEISNALDKRGNADGSAQTVYGALRITTSNDEPIQIQDGFQVCTMEDITRQYNGDVIFTLTSGGTVVHEIDTMIPSSTHYGTIYFTAHSVDGKSMPIFAHATLNMHTGRQNSESISFDGSMNVLRSSDSIHMPLAKAGYTSSYRFSTTITDIAIDKDSSDYIKLLITTETSGWTNSLQSVSGSLSWLYKLV